MERKIGEIFEFGGEWYQCMVGSDCENCAFKERKCYLEGDTDDPIGECCCDRRRDSKDVIFKKLEKVGEPYFNGQYGKVLQEYKYYIPPITPDLRIHIIKLGIVGIEIKQNKEDMVESKLKPFNLEQAKAGKPVCTRDGRKARIICFDRVTNSTNEYTGHLIVLVTNLNGDEKPFCYTENGNLAGDEYDNHEWDLMMFSEKKSGWANIVIGSDGRPHMGRGIFQSKEAAEDAIKVFSSKLIDTIKIEWYD